MTSKDSSGSVSKVPLIDTTKGDSFNTDVDFPSEPPQELTDSQSSAQEGKKDGK